MIKFSLSVCTYMPARIAIQAEERLRQNQEVDRSHQRVEGIASSSVLFRPNLFHYRFKSRHGNAFERIKL